MGTLTNLFEATGKTNEVNDDVERHTNPKMVCLFTMRVLTAEARSVTLKPTWLFQSDGYLGGEVSKAYLVNMRQCVCSTEKIGATPEFR